MRARLGIVVLLVLVLGGTALGARAAVTVPPTPDPAFLGPVPGGECTPQTTYEKHMDEEVLGHAPGTARYGDACKRIRFKFGPIIVKPGQNEALLEAIDIEKPAYDGYIVRFKPDLVRVSDGTKPPTEQLHLHHATWLNLYPQYGDGPFFAAGEEKTIAWFPDGYGMEVGATDAWGLLYMVHNAVAQPEAVWITYDIDYVAKADAEALGIKPVLPVWLDVQKHRIHPDAPSTSANPVFNVQRGFGHTDAETGTKVCRWPDENCARFDTYGNVTPQQGVDLSEEIAGTDWVVPEGLAGTIIGLGGHLHPGGIRDEVSLVRGGVEKPIFISDALYWDFEDPAKAGGPPASWNLSMTVTGLPLGWGVKIKPGDTVRINAVYDAELASWYENMGIVVALVAPELQPGDKAVDVFDDDVVLDRGYPAMAKVPAGGTWYQSGFTPNACTPDLDGPTKRLCLRGMATHGAVPESGNDGGCPPGGCSGLPSKEGPITSDIVSTAFTYGNADFGTIATLGVPRLVKGQPARFWSADTLAKVWHTFTRCKEPCTGATGVDYPLANGTPGVMDFESMELGYGLFYDPAKSQIGGNDPYDFDWLRDGGYWEFTPEEEGTYTFYCRIHPSMRGAFEVVSG